MGHRDAEGWFFFDYRKGGGIRHNGDFVNPGFVEKVIAEHPRSPTCSSTACRRPPVRPGEKDVVAAVVPRSRDVRSGRRLRALPRGLEPNFVPSYLQVVDEIPKTALGEAAGALPARSLRARRAQRPQRALTRGYVVRVVMLGGGIGCSRLAIPLARTLGRDRLTLVVNTADDLWRHGLRICPDLDTNLYRLSGLGDREPRMGSRG